MAETADNTWNQRILEHESWLRTVVRSRIASADEADDVMQSVMTDALAAENRSADVTALGPWLYRLTVNAVLQFRRKCGRRRRLHDGFARETSQTENTQPLDLLLGDEKRELVQDALAGMSGEDVEVLLLKYVHGWNYSQISERLGLEHHRIANRLRRARTRLKDQLQRLGLENTNENE